MIEHPIDPVYDERSTVLILGSFPSVKSREAGFFYGHPQNRFWKVLARVYAERTGNYSELAGEQWAVGATGSAADAGLKVDEDVGDAADTVNVPQTIDEKKEFLLAHGIAVWDVIASCDITGSSDSSIRNVIANDLSVILNTADIRHIFTNGRKADELYRRYIRPVTNREAICLPSTSPANAAWSVERLVEAWRGVRG